MIKEFDKIFKCPHCKIRSPQTYTLLSIGFDYSKNAHVSATSFNHANRNGDLTVSICRNCTNSTLWLEGNLIYPKANFMPEPTNDMAENVKMLYIKAMDVFEVSPEASAAFLRLSLEVFCDNYNCHEHNLYWSLLKLIMDNNLDSDIADCLTHIGLEKDSTADISKINLDENKETVLSLFNFINYLTELMITYQKYKKSMLSKIMNLKNEPLVLNEVAVSEDSEITS